MRDIGRGRIRRRPHEARKQVEIDRDGIGVARWGGNAIRARTTTPTEEP